MLLMISVTNIEKTPNTPPQANRITPGSGVFLDTLAQPVPRRENLRKRARSKHITNNLVIKLAALDSPLKQSYWNSWHCAEVLQQEDQTITGKYCNNRWCLTCNRIRTAKLINGYSEPLNVLTDKRFVTLTIPNVPGDQLKRSIEEMTRQLGLIQKAFRKKGAPIVGIRKLEVTFNASRNDFHPHFHLIVAGENVSRQLINEWLKRFPEANRGGQDEKPADEGSIIELFKYFTKLVTNKRFYVAALDTIFMAMYGKRTFQPMGIKKNVSEDVDELQSIVYPDLDPRESLWTWVDLSADWVDLETGETLTGYVPEPFINKLIESG